MIAVVTALRMNTNEQNRRQSIAIRELTLSFRAGAAGVPSAVYALLESRGIEAKNTVLICASRDDQGVNPFAGLFLTANGTLIDLDCDCNSDGSHIIDLHACSEVTCEDEYGTVPGTGKTIHTIARDVANQLGLEGSQALAPEQNPR